MIVNVCPTVKNLSETLSSLNFSARARNAVLSLGNRDTIKKWRDVVSSLVDKLLCFAFQQLENYFIERLHSSTSDVLKIIRLLVMTAGFGH